LNLNSFIVYFLPTYCQIFTY
jgi:hypothetical protein